MDTNTATAAPIEIAALAAVLTRLTDLRDEATAYLTELDLGGSGPRKYSDGVAQGHRNGLDEAIQELREAISSFTA